METVVAAIRRNNIRTLKEFSTILPSAYSTCKQDRILDAVISSAILQRERRKKGSYTKEECILSASQCQTKMEFRLNYSKEYSAAKRLGVLQACWDVVTTLVRQPRGYWTKARCEEAASTCQTIQEFKDRYSHAYSISHEHGWFERATRHITRQGHLYSRFIYAIEFCDNSVYIGLTSNTKNRLKNHKTSSSFKQKFRDYDFKFLVVKSGLEPSSAARAEDRLIKKYRSDGWTVLNKQRGGGLGGGPSHYKLGDNIKWTKQRVIDAAMVCKSRTDFYTRFPGARDAMNRKDWTKEVLSHLPKLPRTGARGPLKWTKDVVRDIANRMKSRIQFKTEHPGAYEAMHRNGWQNELMAHIANQRQRWTKTAIKDSLSTVSSRKEFMGKFNGAYLAIFKNGWEVELLSKFPAREIYWTIDRVKIAAKKCKNRTQFKEKYAGAYDAMIRNKWHEQVHTK